MNCRSDGGESMSKNTFVEGSFEPLIKRVIDKKDMPMICVYKNPSDFPDKYVARLFRIKPGGDVVATRFVKVDDSYYGLIPAIPLGMMKLSRNMQDDPSVIESWW